MVLVAKVFLNFGYGVRSAGDYFGDCIALVVGFSGFGLERVISGKSSR